MSYAVITVATVAVIFGRSWILLRYEGILDNFGHGYRMRANLAGLFRYIGGDLGGS
jgi:hypothetical protein